MMSILMVGIPLFNGPHECNEFARNNPVKISIFNSFIMFVFFDIESSEVIPSESNSMFKSLQTMQKCTIIKTFSRLKYKKNLKQHQIILNYLTQIMDMKWEYFYV